MGLNVPSGASNGRLRPRVAHVVGARPNYMKVAPVFAALERRCSVDQYLVHTGQHYDAAVNDVFFAELPLPKPDVQLRVGSGRHGEQTARALEGLEGIFLDIDPDLVVVPGDVNSTLAAALAAAKLNIPVCHLEAGLRSFDATMPEEHNRRLTDHMSTLLLTHSEEANENLEREGIPSERVELVGNTMIDSLLTSLDRARDRQACRDFGVEPGTYVLVTLHRPALVDDTEMLIRTAAALERLGKVMPVIFPIHPRTQSRLAELGLAPNGGVRIVAPESYERFLSLQADAAAVVTDSGGVQEETTVLGVPCFTLRDGTERPVTITHGTNTIMGLDPERILEVPALLQRDLLRRCPPLWDGCAGERAATAIERVAARAAHAPIPVIREPALCVA